MEGTRWTERSRPSRVRSALRNEVPPISKAMTSSPFPRATGNPFIKTARLERCPVICARFHEGGRRNREQRISLRGARGPAIPWSPGPTRRWGQIVGWFRFKLQSHSQKNAPARKPGKGADRTGERAEIGSK